MTVQLKARLDLIIASSIVLSFIGIVVWIAIFAQSEGRTENAPMLELMADKGIYLFPIVKLTAAKHKYGLPNILWPFILNVLLYSFIVALVFSKTLANSSRYKPFSVTMISTLVLAAVILSSLIYAAWRNS